MGDLKVNKLTSVKTQLPYSYYTLPYCQPTMIIDSVENLGEILTGDLIENSPYEMRMKVNETCKLLCKQTLTPEIKDKFKSMIHDEYLVNWIVDNLPAATRYVRRDLGQADFTYMSGFPVGIERNGKFYVHNHVTLDIFYHSNPDEYEGYRIVGFEVEPKTLSQATRPVPDDPVMCDSGGAAPLFDLDAH